MDENDVAQGVYPEIIREIAKIKNWKLEFFLNDWAKNLELLEKGQIDLMVSIIYSKNAKNEIWPQIANWIEQNQ